MITVRDGLPQSYVSHFLQDKNGFLWTSTLNGLGRYDGRNFKQYHRTLSDTNGLSGNAILYMLDAGNDDMLLCYMDGKMDLMNSITEKVVPLPQDKIFSTLKSQTSFFKSLVRNSKGICWMMQRDGGIFQIDLKNLTGKHLSFSDLHLQQPVLGIAIKNDRFFLFTQSEMFICDSNEHITAHVPYPFKKLATYYTGIANIYSPAVRTNGDLIFCDTEGIKIWNPVSGYNKEISLNRSKSPGKLVSFDYKGNYFFEFNNTVYLLSQNDSLINWSREKVIPKGLLTSMFVDRSGVLWVGTNGFGLRQYILRKIGLRGYENQFSFIADVLSHYQISNEAIKKTFLGKPDPYYTRFATHNDSVWITDANYSGINPKLLLFSGNRIVQKTFHNENATAKNEMRSLRFVCFDKSGSLWGIDQYRRLLKFDLEKSMYKLFPAVEIDSTEDINGMVPDTGSAFYISSEKSFVRFNTLSGKTENLISFLPSKELLVVSNDPDDEETLWLGTLSDGMIRYDKKSKKTQVFSMATGLPNNTVYSILPGSDGSLWCSSNKGIFGFNRKNQTVKSFTSRDGLIEDEFNKHFYITFPDGNMAFGGSMGYTIFNPSKLETDKFNPQIVLTGLSVINMPKISQPLSNLSDLHVRYEQNSISAEFAAMEFNFPEKIQYRYMLSGFDKNWIMTGNENKASYTNLPPGSYTLILNASNSNGNWSNNMLRIKIIIAPPFWKTWWFYLMVTGVIFLSVYLFVNARISSLKKSHAEKLRFERKAMELHALALRARMNPHFIFNCLNSIKALIQEKQDKKAISYLTVFVTLIRKQLNNISNEITLGEELETCRLYMELESMRFDGRIAFHFDIEENEMIDELIIPPLTLQPVVENAIVHGLLPKKEGGVVKIKVYKDKQFVVCEIEDDGIGRAAALEQKRKSSRLHESKGLHLLEERFRTQNDIHKNFSSLQIMDLVYPDGSPSGTLVIIKFKLDYD
jgi:ligand-binding sensor domain-containing protein